MVTSVPIRGRASAWDTSSAGAAPGQASVNSSNGRMMARCIRKRLRCGMKFGDHRRVIRGAFMLARLAVNAAGVTFRRQRRTAQDMIDAEPLVAGGGIGAGIPPAEAL